MITTIKLGPHLRSEIEALFPNIDDMVLYINSMCNLRCRHCYVGTSLLNANNSFATDDVCHFVRQFTKLSRITVLGGEPLMHRGINNIIRTTLDVPIADRRITTNLTSFFFLDRRQFLNSALTFAVSLDGHDAPTHDQIRGPRSFDNTVSNLRRLIDEDFDVEVSHTVTTKSVDHFESLVSLCKSIGVTKLSLHKMSLQGNAIGNHELFVEPARWIAFCSDLQRLDSLSSLGIAPLRVRYPPIYVTLQEFERLVGAKEYWNHRERSYYAEGDGRRIVLYANGRVYISSELFGTESHIGTIDGGSFRANDSPTSELMLPSDIHDPRLLLRLGSSVRGDKDHPVALSVSFKKVVHL